MLNKITDVFVIAACIVAIGVGVGRLRERSASRPQAGYQAGDVLADEDAGLPASCFERRQRTLVLYVSSHCRFSTASMKFYRELAAAAASRRQSGQVRLVAVGREDLSTLTK